MDVYGYQSYPYNQSDELAKQAFAHQALASSLPFNRGNPEPHYMPAPSGAPWNVQGVTWGSPSPPQLVQFTAPPPTPLPSPSQSTPVHCKRKSLDVEPVIPAKQLITEEKMAAHLNSLHISSDFTSHRLAGAEAMEMEPLGLDTGSGPSLDKLKGRVVLSEELKKIKSEPLLPAALIERLEKPHMSLVVWKPKEEILKVPIKEEDEEDLQETPVRRHGVLVAEHCTMDVEM